MQSYDFDALTPNLVPPFFGVLGGHIARVIGKSKRCDFQARVAARAGKLSRLHKRDSAECFIADRKFHIPIVEKNPGNAREICACFAGIRRRG